MNRALLGVVDRVRMWVRCLRDLRRGQRVYLWLGDHGWEVVGGEFEV
jgi:hypothetical protein